MYRKILKRITSGEFSGIRSEIAHSIKNGKLGKKQIKKICGALFEVAGGNEYISKDCFFKIVPNAAEWTGEYLEKICSAVVNGDMSESLLLHMAEVVAKVNKKISKVVVMIVIVSIVMSVLIIGGIYGQIN